MLLRVDDQYSSGYVLAAVYSVGSFAMSTYASVTRAFSDNSLTFALRFQMGAVYMGPDSDSVLHYGVRPPTNVVAVLC